MLFCLFLYTFVLFHLQLGATKFSLRTCLLILRLFHLNTSSFFFQTTVLYIFFSLNLQLVSDLHYISFVFARCIRWVREKKNREWTWCLCVARNDSDILSSFCGPKILLVFILYCVDVSRVKKRTRTNRDTSCRAINKRSFCTIAFLT